MSKILVTGASGGIGRKTVLHLLRRRPATSIVALARDPAKAADLAAMGVEVRQGDYLDRSSLTRALEGIEKVMLTSTHAFTDRNTAHGNVIEEAARAGVAHLVFMPIHKKKGSSFTMKEVTAEDIFTVEKIRASGMTYTIAEHPPFFDTLSFHIGPRPDETGIHMPAGDGKFAAATRDDLAEAHAAILTEKGHENRTYSLTGETPVSFADIAEILSKVTGKRVPYVPITDDELRASRRSQGVPEPVIEFGLGWVHGMNGGEWQETTRDLATLIGHAPTSADAFFRNDFFRREGVT